MGVMKLSIHGYPQIERSVSQSVISQKGKEVRVEAVLGTTGGWRVMGLGEKKKKH